MGKPFKIALIIASIAVLASPFSIYAANKTKFHYAGWIPYWKQQPGAQDTALNLDKLNEISPFSYEVGAGGALVDKLKINQGFWPAWLSAAHDQGIKIIPTIAWFDGPGIHALLSNTRKRINHEDKILKLLKTQKFDGIDIDYESKLAETKDYFSTFLKGLAMRLHPLGKTLSCTIEARMPVAARYFATGTPLDFQYANDYMQLNKYCDEVRVMAYDQGVVDIELDASKGTGQLYAPVSDPDWASKVLGEALKSINPKKIMLGVPTYGYEYQVTWDNGIMTYERLRSDTFTQAMNRADQTSSTPQRNNAGELSFIYTTSTYVSGVSNNLTWTLGSALNSLAPQILADSASQNLTTRYVSFADSQSAATLIALAKKLHLRGVAFFKLDGDQDPNLWNVMK